MTDLTADEMQVRDEMWRLRNELTLGAQYCWAHADDGTLQADTLRSAFQDLGMCLHRALSDRRDLPTDLPLRCEREDRGLAVRVGEGTLRFAAQNHPEFYDESGRCRVRVTDLAQFAKEVVRSLNKESEDGSTPVSRLLDAAISDVIEYGGDGVELVDPVAAP